MIYPRDYDIYSMYGNDAQNADKGIADYQELYSIDYSATRNILRTMPFYDLFSALKDNNCPYMAIDNEVWIMDAPHIDIHEQHAITNNNINQNGCFAVNFSINRPYEHEELWCVDINKDLISHIGKILQSMCIDSSSVYSADENREIVCNIRDAANKTI